MVSFRSLMAITLAAPARCAIVDLIAIIGEHNACPEGFKKVDHNDKLNGDLNQGANGQYIWLCVRESVTETDDPITDLTVVAKKSSDCKELGDDWHRIRNEQGSNGDLNQGAGGKYLYLCYRKDASKGPLLHLKLNDGDCDDGFFRAETAEDSNGDLNQKAHGKYIYLCASRGCKATEVQGEWVTHGGQIAGATTEKWGYGTDQSISITKTEDWKESVTTKVKQGWRLKGKKGNEGSVEITGETAHETSKSYTSAWSESNTHEYEVKYDDADKGKQPWQFQFSPTDSCGNTVQSSAQTLAVTEGAFRPPCCVPGFATDAPYYKVCNSQETMIPDGEEYGCTVDASASVV